jgi:hypothetical protein
MTVIYFGSGGILTIVSGHFTISSGLFILYGEFSILTVIYTKVAMKKGLQARLE